MDYKKVVEHVITLLIGGMFFYGGHRILEIGKSTDSLTKSVIELKTTIEQKDKSSDARDEALLKVYSLEMIALKQEIEKLKEIIEEYNEIDKPLPPPPAGDDKPEKLTDAEIKKILDEELAKMKKKKELDNKKYQEELRGKLYMEQHKIQQTIER